jgi:phosphoserine phosphatase RsbU/P
MNKILIVDSFTETLELLAQCISTNKNEVITSNNGANALIKSQVFLPDLIILDTNLPDTSAFDLCKKIKTSKETKYILILMVSVNPSKDILLRSIESGADDFMEKSFVPLILLAKVNSLLQIKRLSNQLKLKYSELEEKNNILDFQLKMGQQVQQSLISEVDFKFNNAHFVSKYLPALYIGGDFYNFVQLNDDCIAVVIGDVSGHGVSAALITAMLNMMFSNLVYKYSDPKELMYFINKSFCTTFKQNITGIYACVFYAIIDTKNHEIHYSNAGQTLPILLNKLDGTTKELYASGIPIGLMQDSTYTVNSCKYHTGDTLFFYTDGLCDSFYKNSNSDFLNKLKNLLLEYSDSYDNNEIIEIILNEFYNKKRHFRRYLNFF